MSLFTPIATFTLSDQWQFTDVLVGSYFRVVHLSQPLNQDGQLQESSAAIAQADITGFIYTQDDFSHQTDPQSFILEQPDSLEVRKLGFRLLPGQMPWSVRLEALDATLIPGAAGAQGLKGDKGDTGATGAAGAQGLKGDKGDTGVTGAAGAPGAQGLKGDKGDTGDTGAAGSIDLSVSRAYTAAQGVTPSALIDAATIAVDAALSNTFTVTLAGNRTLENPSNLQSGFVYNLHVAQDSVGSRTLAFGTAYKFTGTAPVLSTAPNAIDWLSFQCIGSSLRFAGIKKGFNA